MAGLSFFNPAVFAPSADVAVRPAPAADYSPIQAAISDSMKYVQETVRKKRDIDNLREETRQLADYVAPQSQPLSIYLKEQADNYDLFTTDPAEARQSLLKNTIGFLNVESQRIRALQDQNTVRFENFYKARLNSANQNLESLLRDRQKWEAEENDRYMAQERLRVAASNNGNDLPAYVKRPYPNDGKIADAEAHRTQLMNMTNADVQQMATVIGGGGGVGNVNPFDRMNQRSNGQNTSNQTPAPFETPEIPERRDGPIDTSLLNPGDAYQGPDQEEGEVTDGLPVGNSSPVPGGLAATINEAVSGVPLTEKGPDASLFPAPTPTVAPLNPNTPVDEITQNARQKKAEFEYAKTSALKRVDRVIDSIIAAKSNYDKGKIIDGIAKKREEIKAQIAAIPNPGRKLWTDQVNDIFEDLNAEIRTALPRTATQEDKQNMRDSMVPVTMSISDGKGGVAGTFPAIKTKDANGNTVYMAYNQQTRKNDESLTTRIRAGQVSPVNDPDFTKDSNNPVNIKAGSGPVGTTPATLPTPIPNVIKPGASIPSVIEQLKQKGTQ